MGSVGRHEPEIRVERVADHAGIRQVVALAFADEPGVADMVEAIRRSDRYRPDLAFVAAVDDDLVGFVMLSGTDLVDDVGRRREVLTLSPLAVTPARQRSGVGSALVLAALAAAERADEPLVVLEGSPQYYGRLGFRYAGDHGITLDLPDWAPPEAAQVFILPGYDPAIRGRVEYPPAIADHADHAGHTGH